MLSNHSSQTWNQHRHRAGPSGLVAGPNARAIVAMEVLIEEYQVAPVWIGLELLRAAVDRPAPRGLAIGAAALAAQEGADDPPADLAGDLAERDQVS